MKRRVLCAVLALALVVSMCFVLAACDNKTVAAADDTVNIVYLGDSIAEALIGPSPLNERDNYGYYALVGRTNGFNYYNHSVSGHKTSGLPGGGLLGMLERETEDASLMITHLKQADIIHISILGNNALQYNLGAMVEAVASSDFESNYENGTTIINRMVDGGSIPIDGVTYSFPDAREDIANVVEIIYELNPDAKLLFQTVYNPVFEGTTLLPEETKAVLATMTDDGRFGSNGDKITTYAQYRAIADEVLKHLNGVLYDYLADNPDAFEIIDAHAAFKAVADSDTVNGYNGDSLGCALIFPDWVHPSNIGHAIMARLIQDKLVEWNMAADNAVDNYKSIRIDQINRLYSEIEGFNTTAAISAINAAETYQGVSDAYFDAIGGYTPIWF